jgi:nitroreductase
MELFDAIVSRRSVKHYDPEHEFTQDEKDKLLSHAILSPTAFNIQHWRFVVVEDKALRQQIREQAWDQAQVTDASMLIVLCVDLKAWEKDAARYWVNAPQEVQDMLVPMIGTYYEGRDQVQRDEAMRCAGMAAQTLMLSAKAMGYESCPMSGFDYDAVGELVSLPDDHAAVMMLSIGKGVKEAWPRPGQLPLDEVVVTDRF